MSCKLVSPAPLPPVEAIVVALVPMCAWKQCIYHNETVIARLDRGMFELLYRESVLLQRAFTAQAVAEAIAVIRRERPWL